MSKTREPIELDDDIADQIKGLKPTYNDRLPLIEERLSAGVSIAVLAKTFKKGNPLFPEL